MSSSSTAVVLEVGAHRCGIPVEVVRSLHRMVAVLPLPGAPPVIDGVIDVHGTAVAVLNLRARLGLTPVPVSPDHHLVLVDLGGGTVALRADRALDVTSIEQGAPEDVERLRDSRLDGIARMADGLLLVHDVERFLSKDEATALEKALLDLDGPAS